MKISVFVNTLNEEKNIRRCLESVRWADEIVVVDMHSDDATVAIAREYTSKVYSFERCGFCEPARAFAYEQTTGDWILNIDADEMVTEPLYRRMLSIVEEDSCDVVGVPWKNYHSGICMTASGCGPLQCRPLRFFRRGALSFGPQIHNGVFCTEGSRKIELSDPEQCLLHFAYVSPDHLWQKVIRYTTIEAQQRYERGETVSLFSMIRKMTTIFFKKFIRKGRGYRDRAPGFIFCFWSAVYESVVFYKLFLMHRFGTADLTQAIDKEHSRIAEIELQRFSIAKDENNKRGFDGICRR